MHTALKPLDSSFIVNVLRRSIVRSHRNSGTPVVIKPAEIYKMALPFNDIAALLQQAIASVDKSACNKFTLHIYPTDINGYQVITEAVIPPPTQVPSEDSDDSLSLPSLTPSMEALLAIPNFVFYATDMCPTSPPPSIFSTMLESSQCNSKGLEIS